MFDVEVTVDPDGRLVAVRLQRWNDSAEPPGYAPFGGDLTDEFVTAAGVRIAGAGTVGWEYGTADWSDGRFFEFAIRRAVPPTIDPSRSNPTSGPSTKGRSTPG